MFHLFRANVKNAIVASGQVISYILRAMNHGISFDLFRLGMQNRRFCCFALAWLLIPAALSAQILSVQLKVREARLFGITGQRFAKLEFSNQTRIMPLTSENVNGGKYFYFLLRPVGTWEIDPDFIQEEMPKLTLQQNDKIFQIGAKEDIARDSAGSLIMLGFPKDLKLHQAFFAQFRLADSTVRAQFEIPQEYWPGYPMLMDALKATERAIEEKRYRDGIAVCEQALRADAFQIFPQVNQFRDRRIAFFERLQGQALSSLAGIIGSDKQTLKEKIAQLDQLKPTFQFVLDSLPSVAFNISAADSSVGRLLQYASITIAKSRSMQDSLQLALDDQNVRWIVEGSATGKNGNHYQYMIETLAYAFSSMDFADSSRKSLIVAIPPEMKARLTKNELEESYTTFIRQCGDRLRQRAPLFPPEFLNNIRADTTSFSLPYYSMLKAVNDYFEGSFSTAMDEIIHIFRRCYEPELSARFDLMRVYINFHQKGTRTEALKFLAQAAAEESAGRDTVASERYQDAVRVAPDFAYASYRWGRFFAHIGDNIRAQTFFQRAYQTDTLYLSAYRDSYSLYRKSANYKTMIDVLVRALEKGNDFWEINFNLGLAYYGDGDLARAIKQFERALELNPRNYQTNIQLGLAFQTAKDFQKARDYFNSAILIDPYRADAVNYLNKLNELQKNAR